MNVPKIFSPLVCLCNGFYLHCSDVALIGNSYTIGFYDVEYWMFVVT